MNKSIVIKQLSETEWDVSEIPGNDGHVRWEENTPLDCAYVLDVFNAEGQHLSTSFVGTDKQKGPDWNEIIATLKEL